MAKTILRLIPAVLKSGSSWVSGAFSGTTTRRVRQSSISTSTGSSSATRAIASVSTVSLSLSRVVSCQLSAISCQPAALERNRHVVHRARRRAEDDLARLEVRRAVARAPEQAGDRVALIGPGEI